MLESTVSNSRFGLAPRAVGVNEGAEKLHFNAFEMIFINEYGRIRCIFIHFPHVLQCLTPPLAACGPIPWAGVVLPWEHIACKQYMV